MAFQRITNVVERTVSGEAARLRVVHGPDTGLDVRLPGAGVVVGAGDGCDVVLTDPAVSGRHIAITPAPDGFDVEDLDSRNGTFLDGVRIGRARVAIGVTLHAGATAIQLIPAERPLVIEPSALTAFGELLGASRVMRSVYALLERASQSASPVLITGESGTGKELAARAIHDRSARRAGPFVVFDCGAASEALLTSDLFGHARGAFTGAHAERIGAFAAADGGTLFLDEIGELPIALQPKLLRMVESGEVMPLGAQAREHHDVRIVAATNRELWREIATGGFRGDLYYRLAVIEVHMPPLRARREDIPALAAALLARAGVSVAPSGDGLARLLAYSWPGNVRELRNVIARAVALAPGAAFEDMPVLLAPAAAQPSRSDGVDLDRPWAEVKSEVVDGLERAYFGRLFERHGANLTEAARVAGIERKYLYRVLQKLNLRRERDG